MPFVIRIHQTGGPEVMRWETTPSAVEFDMYYSL